MFCPVRFLIVMLMGPVCRCDSLVGEEGSGCFFFFFFFFCRGLLTFPLGVLV